MITDKTYKQQIEALHETYRIRIEKMEERHRDELKQARDLKELLGKFASGIMVSGAGLTWNSISGGLTLTDDIPQYVDDFFGGKVIKQEATKVIHISREGKVTEGLTKRRPDEHFPYLLQRETQ